MCLAVKAGEHEMRLATEDIRVFKMLERNEGNTGWESPFRYTPYYEDTTMPFVPLVARKAMMMHEIHGVMYSVDRGYHSYTSLERGLNQLALVKRNLEDVFVDVETAFNLILVEMTIPQGAWYIQGIDDEIVSSVIRTGKFIDLVPKV